MVSRTYVLLLSVMVLGLGTPAAGHSDPPGPVGSMLGLDGIAKRTLTDCDDCPDLKVLEKWEGERQRLAVSAKITVAHWNKCMADKVCQGWSPKRGDADVHANVSGVGELQFLVWLNKKTGKRYRLISEREFRARTSRFTWHLKVPTGLSPGQLKRIAPRWPGVDWDQLFGGRGCLFVDGSERVLCLLRQAVEALEQEQGFRVARWLSPENDENAPEPKPSSSGAE